MKRAALVLSVALAGCASARRETAEERLLKAPTPYEEIAVLRRAIATLRNFSTPQATSDPDRCPKMRTVAAEICGCADRICVLAEQLAEDDARRSCKQARTDCERARSEAEACK